LILWILRAVVLISGPLIGYLQFGRSMHSALIGLAIAIAIVLTELIIQSIPLDTLIVGVMGIVIGLIVAKLIDYGVYLTENQRFYIIVRDFNLVIKIVCSYLGLVIAIKKKSELDLLDRDIFKKGKRPAGTELIILDTSAVIDGRIADITDTKFLSGVMVLPRFVLGELQRLSDSSDTIKRNKARRGMEIIGQLQKQEGVSVKIYENDYPALPDVDGKLLQLAKDLRARIITTDFNLNKIATLQGVTVLNINDLSNALKPIYLPGEKMFIFPVKEGKEQQQSVGYLEDGTMVVIEDGRKHIGKRIEVTVSSILQTSSGRMVFTNTVPENSAKSNGK
jgi:uncharacterized protein YacL